jgi:hypothetical protein
MGAGFIIAVSFGGPLGVFMRSYALLFYGGHYKALGNLLEPSAALSADAAGTILWDEVSNRSKGRA